MPRKRKTKVQSIQPVINPHAAGADIGAREIYVAVPSALTAEPVRCFPTFTEDLRALVAWLQSFGIKGVLKVRGKTDRDIADDPKGARWACRLANG